MTRRFFLRRGGLFLLFLLAACDSNPARPDNERAAALAVFMPTEETTEAAAVEQPDPARPHAAAPASRAAIPDAIYTLDSGNNALPPETEQSLRAIVQRIKVRRDLLVRLDSYAPANGSREMSLSLSRQAAVRIKRRLVELGVPSYRIQQAPLGAEYPDESQLSVRRVELFLLPLGGGKK
ncbi:MAG: OmpA family protein [Zoogloeaceae bacterium]|jgi:outer membrane protein OmpA-like peptidoglycan-associated protein|nr:OmpA family protein [Zoogloeaceae bacterium]